MMQRSILCILVGSGAAFAACQTATITASTPTADFTVNGNGTVTHKKTGLMWKRCSEGLVWNGTTCTGTVSTHTWQAALQLAESLNNGAGFATYKDWRVPNVKELMSIMENQCTNPAINATIFPATAVTGYYYWSATSIADAGTAAWGVNFNTAFVGFSAGINSISYVRLVRGGQ